VKGSAFTAFHTDMTQIRGCKNEPQRVRRTGCERRWSCP